MAVVLGLLVAASFGSGDFLGGLASRRSPTVLVLALAQVTALVGAVVVALAAGGHLTPRTAGFGAAPPVSSTLLPSVVCIAGWPSAGSVRWRP